MSARDLEKDVTLATNAYPALALCLLSACGAGSSAPSAPPPEAILEFTGSGTGPYVVVYNRAETGRGGIEVYAAETCQEAGFTLDYITHPPDGGRAIFHCREAFR